MAKVRIPINPLQTGRVGAYSMYVRKGEQIIRQRKNSSNYGPEASRSEAQQVRRIKWANVVNFYKACKFWMQKAFENKKPGLTDYNAFMAANIERGHIYLTKTQAAEGCCVLDNLIVSKGSLPSMSCEWEAENYQFNTGLSIDTAFPAGVTVGWISDRITENNIGWQQGDNLAFVFFMLDIGPSPASPEDRRPRLYSRYLEMTIDTNDSRAISLHPLAKYMSLDSNGNLQIGGDSLLDGWVGAACIHTRLNGQLSVSTQEIKLAVDDFVDWFSTPEFRQICMESYGVSETVPLDPSFSNGAISEILVNGSPINRDLIYGSAIELTVKGENMQDHVTLRSGNNIYTPLFVSNDGSEWTYLLTTNGDFVVSLNGTKVRMVTLENIVIPSELPANFNMQQRTTATVTSEGVRINNRTITANCINYNFLKRNDYPYFYFRAGDNMQFDNFVVHNATVSNHDIDNNGRVRMSMLVTDASKAAYITYKEIVVAVFNYE